MRSSSSSSRSSGVKGSPLYNPCVMKVIVARDLVKYHGGDLKVLSGATLSVEAGEKIGLVGRNGAGKTTLLDLLAGHSEPDSGSVEHPGGAKVGMTTQKLYLGERGALSGGGDHLRLRALDGPREGARGARHAPLRGPIERAHGTLWQASE